ncbi:ethanolamine ammonia-lyase light chain [Plasticicumulans lactativorans]|uniref:Ethanolamine ammonia-lyase small subunit n=1 Tax=Plasticicumulans lactativorans TaxID=1133106 RepID=A0A4R2L4C4_9GAMM|nr:ethanolamine ammonia-lyase subunit EutC [Plasticicumulans lactativorans]TCO80592.1 ethanolamine ammonia-lyase light chain [Plasticicumulans lactativorans]
MAADEPVPAGADPWLALARHTPARIALGRVGASLPSAEVLRFGLAHAQARDAVHRALDLAACAGALAAATGLPAQVVQSQAPDRATYLRRPDLGRRLAPAHAATLAMASPPPDLAVIVADGLSALAVEAHALPLLVRLRRALADLHWAPLVVAGQGRVALGDEIGERLGARLALILIGERPGLSSPDSLGAYLTYAPRPGRSDAERNCVSNIRPAGLDYPRAAHTLAWLVREALQRRVTGVALKDESALRLLDGAAAAPDAEAD